MTRKSCHENTFVEKHCSCSLHFCERSESQKVQRTIPAAKVKDGMPDRLFPEGMHLPSCPWMLKKGVSLAGKLAAGSLFRTSDLRPQVLL